jgi:hypothetical protein
MKASAPILLAVCIVGLAALPARADNPQEADVKVPFSFVVSNELLPAGQYTVRVSQDDPSVIVLQSADQSHVVVLDTQWGGNQPLTSAKLRFAQYGATHFLTGVGIEGESLRDVPVTRADVMRELARLDRQHAERTANGY